MSLLCAYFTYTTEFASLDLAQMRQHNFLLIGTYKDHFRHKENNECFQLFLIKNV